MFFTSMYFLPLACINFAANKRFLITIPQCHCCDPELRAGFPNDRSTNAITNSKLLDLFTEFINQLANVVEFKSLQFPRKLTPLNTKQFPPEVIETRFIPPFFFMLLYDKSFQKLNLLSL